MQIGKDEEDEEDEEDEGDEDEEEDDEDEYNNGGEGHQRPNNATKKAKVAAKFATRHNVTNKLVEQPFL
ncbi:MAG: hypothetical protein ASARMPRED_006281 [Alectoria sarmentosa]|nr:MAG: hypothetical protein ASARMPRED_006281 [Alectoria sarmentosa]